MVLTRDYLTIKELVLTRIRADILRGALPPGTWLRQDQLAREFGVSRMPVREALLQLEVEGYVKLHRHRGAVVRELSSEQVEEIYLTRAALEGFATRLGVPHLKSRDLKQMEGYIQQMEGVQNKSDVAGFLLWDKRFHDVIYAAADRKILREKIDRLWENSHRYIRVYFLKVPDAKQRAIVAHRRIWNACSRGDVEETAKLMQEHLAQAPLGVLASSFGQKIAPALEMSIAGALGRQQE